MGRQSKCDREATAENESFPQLTPAVLLGMSATLSIGIAPCPPQSAELDRLIAMADRALYDSKSRGRDRVSFASLEIAAATAAAGPPAKIFAEWRAIQDRAANSYV
jgi:predicted signal transduction protein with EAL and GGDEF domain